VNFTVYVRRSAKVEITEAQTWYETQQSGLGLEFLSALAQVIDRLAETPLIYQLAHRNVRRAIVRRFPYFVWYRVEERTVTILACTHFKQHNEPTQIPRK